MCNVCFNVRDTVVYPKRVYSFVLFFSEVTTSFVVNNINRLVFVRDIVFSARQCVSENCLLYMEHRVVLHTEYNWEVGAISHNCVGWYFAVQFIATCFGSFKNPPSSNLKYTERDHLIHRFNIIILRAVEIPVILLWVFWGPKLNTNKR